MSAITTHILDTARGRPASGVAVVLAQRRGDAWTELAAGTTNADGRIGDLLPAEHSLAAGVYRLSFALEAYFRRHEVEAFYPAADVVFQVRDPEQHYHVPLLLSPFGYTTYRGS